MEQFTEIETQIEEQVDRARRDGYREGFRQGQREMSELAERWRQSYEALRLILAECGTNADFERLDELMREWVAAA